MDFSLTEEQIEYRNAVSKFGQKELNQSLVEREKHAEFSFEAWKKCADFGIQGLVIPEAYGGVGSDILTAMLVMEGLGYGCHDKGLTFSLNAQMWAVQMPILNFGTEEQKHRYLPGLCSGQIIGVHGMTEPDTGSDAFKLSARAERKDGGYIINGTKMFVTNGPYADFAMVFATVNPDKGRWGITAFLIDKDTPGFSMGSSIDKMGLRTSPMSELVLQDCYIPEGNRLGPEGAGGSIFTNTMGWERSCSLACHIGAMEYQIEQCVQYANDRIQFDQSIGKFQSISNRIVEMKVRLETARLLLYKTAWKLKNGEQPGIDAAMTKLYLSECFVQSSLDAIRIHGGYGYMTEFEVERDLRDAVGGTFYAGTSDIQRVIIAGLLGL